MGVSMRKMLLLLALLGVSISGPAQTASSSNSDQHHSKKSKGEITARGCLGRAQTDYILTQADKGNAYELEGARLRKYLGKEVEVTGTESPSMSTSSDYLARSGAASSVTIRVREIKVIADRCSGN